LCYQYPRKYDTLIRQQNRIGWRQLFSGRLCREWARLQNDYLYIRHQRFLDTRRQTQENRYSRLSDRRNGTAWSATIIQEIWDRWFEVWALRNADVHGTDQTTRQEQRDLHDRMRLQTIYEQSDRIEPRVRDELLYENIEDHLQNSRHTLNNWLAVHEATISQSIKVATKRAIQGIHSIRSYFATGRPPGSRQLRHVMDITKRGTKRERATAHRRQLQTPSPAGP
jgi:hypothetical protein